MLSRKRRSDLLRQIPLFGECTRTELEAIAGLATELALPAGRVLMRQGEPGRELLVLVEGEVEVSRDGKTVGTMAGGDFVGELALVTRRPRSATVTATTDLRVLVVGDRDFHRLLRDVPTLAVKVLRAVGERLPAEHA